MVEAVIMGEMLAILAEHPVSKRDKKSLIYLGAIMALFDVIIDDFKLPGNTVHRILENTFSSVRRAPLNNETAIEKVYYLYLDKLTGIIEMEQWSEIAGRLSNIKSQIESDVQTSETISEENVTLITLEKGGVSALICSAFIRQKNDSFKDAVFQIGGFIQMMNDCQDMYKDTIAGIKTFVHFCKSFDDIFIRLNEQRIKTFRLIRSLDYPQNVIYKTLFDLNAMFIIISYKLHLYSEICDYRLDFKAIGSKDKKSFRINPFSLQSLRACSPKILPFDFNNSESTPGSKFEMS